MSKNKNNYRPVAALILSDSYTNGEKFLIVKKPRKKHAWQFPQGGVNDDECFLAAAERELWEECGKDLEIVFLYSWPVGEYQYDFPIDFYKYEEYAGACVQFFRGILDSGKVKVDNKEIVDYRWVYADDFANYFDSDYLKAVQDFI